jgi:hypothetical protein
MSRVPGAGPRGRVAGMDRLAHSSAPSHPSSFSRA